MHGYPTELFAFHVRPKVCSVVTQFPHFSLFELPKQNTRTSKASFIHSFYKYLLSTYYMTGSWETSVNKLVSGPCRAYLVDRGQAHFFC